ncbi:MAG: hypothetical protein E7674_03095 [Ruminococcaceae bacterium]|nr:hypothetical protein [Oscillospiraceae bacterium]
MSSNIKNYKIFVLVSLAASVCMAVGRLYVIMNNIEMQSLTSTEGLYYLEGTNAPLVFALFCIGLGILFFAGAVFFAGKIKNNPEKDSVLTTFASALLGMMLLTLVIYYVYTFVFEKRVFNPWLLAVIILSVISAFYFLFISSRRAKARMPRVIPVLSVAPILLTAVRLLNDFMERSLTVNASSYVYHLLGLVLLMLFWCCEGRTTVGYRRKRMYVFLGLITIMLLLVYCIPALYLSLFWPIKFTDVTVFCMADLVAVLYIACRLVMLPAPEEVQTEPVTAQEE